MSQPNNQQFKWIALSVLFLFILGGGAYKLSHRSQNTTSNSSSIGASTVFGKSSTPSAPRLGVGIPSIPSIPNTTGAITSLTPQPASPVADAPKTELVAPPADQCVTMTYKHKTLASHPDEESCSHHKNILKLMGSEINAKSVCVRVNGTPVHYLSIKGHSDELMFGSVAGPKAKVTVRYCMGKGPECAKFNEDCTVPKDEFMEAIGGTAGDSKDAKLGQWDPTHPSEKEADVMARLDGEVKKELETNDDLNGRAPAGEMFKDWIGEIQTNPCGTKQASN